MDKALPSGGRDCGFESRLGLSFLCIVEAGGAGWTTTGDQKGLVDEQQKRGVIRESNS